MCECVVISLSYKCQCILICRSVDELTTFYILRWVNNVFHILLKIWHIIVWFGPNCLGKSTPSFKIYDMIKNMRKCLSHHAFIIVKMYIMLSMALYEHGHQWLWCLPVALFYTGVDVMCGDAWLIGILLNNALHILINKYSTNSWLCYPCLKLHHVEL